MFFFTVLKNTLNKKSGSNHGQGAGLRCEHYGQYLGPIKCWEYFDYLSNHKLFGSGYAPWSYSDKTLRDKVM